VDVGRKVTVEVDEQRFEQLVANALDAIPEALGREMDNVAVTVAGLAHLRAAHRNTHRQGTLLGLYEGVSLTRRSPRL
jgi:predicted Zn-dependent protease with MMP-like domain